MFAGGLATDYAALFLACALAGAYPLPEDVVLLMAGNRIAHDELAVGPVLLVAGSGLLLRDLAAFAIGRRLGDSLLTDRRVTRFVPAQRLERARALVARHGTGAVMLGRFLVGFHAPVFLLSGASGLPARTFLLWDVLGLALTLPLLLTLGWWTGDQALALVWSLQARTREVVAVAAIGALAAWWWRTRRAASDEG